MLFPRALAIALALAVLACGSKPPTRVRRPGQDSLVAIQIEGNEALPDDALIPGLQMNRTLRRQGAIDDYQLSIDVTRIEGAYQKLGFFNVAVETSIERKGDTVTLTFHVTEGQRATATVDIQGLPPEIDPDEARALVRLADGDPFEYGRFDAAKGALRELVENNGYAHVQLDATVLADRDKHTALLRYVIDAGPRVTFGDIQVKGVSPELAEAIRNRAGIQPGDAYSTAAVAELQQAIYGIGRFSSVRVDVDRGELATVVPITVTAREAKRSEARAGIGGGLDTLNAQLRMRLSISHAGFPSPLTTVGAEFRPAILVLRDNCVWYEVLDCEIKPRYRLLGTIRQQDLFTRGMNGDIEGGLDYLAQEAWTVSGARVRSGLTMPFLSRRLQARVGWQLAGYNFDDISPAVDAATQARLGIDQFTRVGAFTQGVSIDYRDNPVSPRLGGYAELRIAEGTKLAGGAFDYIQVTPDVRGYLPFGRVVLAGRVRLGFIRGEVAPTERYFAGGAASQRGFAERRLSPTANGVDADGNPISVVIGGAASFETGLELRTFFKLLGVRFGFVVFADGADVTETPEELDVTNLHWAVGVGIRPVYLPIGPIRFEVGYRLNRTGPSEPQPGDRWNYVISVGEAF